MCPTGVPRRRHGTADRPTEVYCFACQKKTLPEAYEILDDHISCGSWVRRGRGGVGAFVAEISLGNRNIHVRVVETVGC